MDDIEEVTLTVAELKEWIKDPGVELVELNSSLDNALSLTKDRQVPHSFIVKVVP